MSITDLTPLHIGLQSGVDSVGVGAMSCREALPDLHALVAAMPLELEELVAAVGAARP
jgi:hypothetical protein